MENSEISFAEAGCLQRESHLPLSPAHSTSKAVPLTWYTGFQDVRVSDDFSCRTQGLVDPMDVPLGSLGITPKIRSTMRARNVQDCNTF